MAGCYFLKPKYDFLLNMLLLLNKRTNATFNYKFLYKKTVKKLNHNMVVLVNVVLFLGINFYKIGAFSLTVCLGC